MVLESKLYIDGSWRGGAAGKTLPVLNPATGRQIATLAHAETADLEQAVAAALPGFHAWRDVSAFERSKVMRKAGDLLRARADAIAAMLTREEGKTLAESKGEVMAAADIIDWFAEEARRTYGRVIPARGPGIYQLVIKQPVGPVAAFTPWNFPILQAVRKLSAALGAGCSIILKGPEEAPASTSELVRAFADAGIPPGAMQLVFGIPSEISEFLVPHPLIRKISFTGSTAVGKRLAALAGLHMKRVTMELGGHAPAIVFEDADIAAAVKLLGGFKFRNAGQVCGAPTRFLVQEKVYDEFLHNFIALAKGMKVGDGFDPSSQMGPLANARRVVAMDGFIADATAKGARVAAGGRRIGNEGNFFEPTVLTDVPPDARIMNEEPFGPVAILRPFRDFDEAITEANRLPYGLASFAFTHSAKTANAVAARVEAGMMSINHIGLALPEVPFGGIKDSGFGTEGGADAMESYLDTKFVSQAGL
ncbi:MAG: NAD-dependent succinate-semialdehyde dehydrogenase [Acetobacteraceae bacterium]